MRAANEIARFVLEVAALAAFVFTAAVSVKGWARYPLAVITLAVVVTFWGVLLAPRSRHRLSDPTRLVVELVYFSAAGVALMTAGFAWPGLALATLAIVNAVSLRFHAPVLGAPENFHPSRAKADRAGGSFAHDATGGDRGSGHS
jgi:hypothetical protein